MQMNFSPRLHRPHLPMPQCMRASSVVNIWSGAKPSFLRVRKTKWIMMGGPQVMVTAFSGEGLTRSSRCVIRPTLPVHPSSPRSTVTWKSVAQAARQSSNSSVKTRRSGLRAAQRMVRWP